MLSCGLFRRWLPLPILLALSACGYVGEPLPPLLNMPQPVADLAALQRGSKIVASFTLPKLTTEGRVIRPPLHWELLAGEQGSGDFRIEDWAARAKSMGEAPAIEGRVEYTFPAAPWTGKDIVLAARVRGPSGHFSGWSKPVALTVIQPPAVPTNVQAQNVAEGVRLAWQGAGPAYRILRQAEGEKDFIPVGNTETQEFVDKNTDYGKTYRYTVQAVAKTGTAEVESESTPQITFTPKDEFPPAPPAGLLQVPTPGSIELTWDRNTESDLAGYRIYRAEPGAPFAKIGETAESPTYSDRKIESGKHYRYAITAFDRSGNESKQSPEIEVTAP